MFYNGSGTTKPKLVSYFLQNRGEKQFVKLQYVCNRPT